MLLTWSSSQGLNALVNSAEFIAPLVTDVSLSRGTGSATFTRATVATVTDHEDVLRNCLSGEVRFQGARRVANLHTFSEDFSNAAWTKTGSTLTSGFTAPDGTATAWRLVGVGASTWVCTQAITITDGTFLESIWVKSNTGSNQTFRLNMAAGGTGDLTATTEWRRFSSGTATGTAGSRTFGIRRNGAASDADLLIWHPQAENVTGQSIQTPGEYVSVGVLSSPFHGAMVDGVKYFATTNGNTVASNVVTEATGSPISSATLKGYLSEPARTNSALWSRDMTNAAWVKTTMTTVQTATGIDGVANSATTLTATAGNAMVLQTLVAAATTRGYAPYIKRISGVGAVQITQDGISWTTVTITSAWTRVTPLILSQLNPVFGIRLVDNADSVAVDMNQFETTTGTVVYSPIPTTTAAVPRNADVLTYPFIGNTTEATGTLYAEVSTAWTAGPDGLACMAVGFGGGVQTSPIVNTFTVGATQMQQSDGTTNQGKNGLASTATGVRKRASSWGAIGQVCTGDGLATPAPQPYDGSYGSTAVGIGCNPANSATQWGGTIRNVRIYSTQLSASQLQAVTA
jgi:hypothetical protein